MNNNRGNNRRRGRGNNNRQQGGQAINRIDSRARGNAPQMLEKYRKLALDAHLNGDRVTEEYNLQFADHYFRVIADQRQRQEDARQPRPDRWQEGGDADRGDSDAGSEYGGENEYQSNPYNYGERRDREPAPRYEERESAPRAEQREEPARARPEPRGESSDEERGAEPAPTAYEPPENPFVRDSNRGPRGLKPRRPRRDAAETAGDTAAATRQEGGDEGAASGLNLAALPPAIAPRVGDEGDTPAAAEAKPKRRAPRRPKPPADDSDGPLQAVTGG